MKQTEAANTFCKDGVAEYIREEEITRFMEGRKDFIDDAGIHSLLEKKRKVEPQQVRDIIQKSLSIQRLEPEETSLLLNVTDPGLWEEMGAAAGEVKKRVYDNRIVVFAPLYLSNFCINNCIYCSFRRENVEEKRRKLSYGEIQKETKSILNTGHKRIIVVYGESPCSNIDYAVKSIDTIYSVRHGKRDAGIRRVNVNAAPMSVDDLRLLKQAGIGTYQVFQETYHHRTYRRVHPAGIKSHYQWRLYALHRAMEAGIDDVAIGALFGLYNWKFEVMGLLNHAIDLEKRYGVGPHTISFPRIKPAVNTPIWNIPEFSDKKVSDEELKRLIIVLRLSVPYTGMILTAREPARLRREILPLGVTQTDASTRIGIGAYSEKYSEQEAKRQQFLIGDTRSLEDLVAELADAGYITSFCTAGYRCGRTGKRIMDMLSKGSERWLCKINAVLTFREWLDDYAAEGTRIKGEKVIEKEIAEIKQSIPAAFSQFSKYYRRIENGERDLYF